jgi:putative methionine-R-sulfoxide reductase with GAF domain
MSEPKEKKSTGRGTTQVLADIDQIRRIAAEMLSGAAKYSEVSKGIFYIAEENGRKKTLKFLTGYACTGPADGELEIEFGEGFSGQVAADRRVIRISDIPDNYMTIESGLGKGKPVSIIVFPVALNGKTIGVAELASFRRFTKDDEAFFLDLAAKAAKDMSQGNGKTKL